MEARSWGSTLNGRPSGGSELRVGCQQEGTTRANGDDEVRMAGHRLVVR
jgi:hypothetical protein